MLEDKVIVQDHGIDAGLAALMQNCNKGMDPSAMMAMMNNGGFGGNGCWWWIWIILLWGIWGGNGFGANGQNGIGRLATQMNNEANTSLLMQAIQGNKEALGTLANTLNCDVNALQAAVNAIPMQMQNCCCDTQRSIDAVNNNITKMGYESQLASCNMTNTLTNTINNSTLQLRDANTANTNAIIAKLDAMQNQALLDKIDALREKNSTMAAQLSNEHQTAAINAAIAGANAQVTAGIGKLQAEVDNIKCKMPPTVSVPYPQLSVYNPEIYRAAAMGSYAGDIAANNTYGGCGYC